MRTLYFDCFAGASGNMILGALIDVGVNKDSLEQKLRGLSIADFELVAKKTDRSGISSTHVEVKVPHEHVHRHLHNIEKIIDDADLTVSVKNRAKAIFGRLAEAEAAVHGIEIGKVHFHEVGAMDAIVDIVGACIAFEMLGIERFSCSKVHVGSGFVNMAHGKFPVPPPAVSKLLSDVPIYSTEIEGELTTPTGAAIISTVCDSYGVIPEMRVEQMGYGAGTREYEKFPNALRIMIGQSIPAGVSHSDRHLTINERLFQIETNLDDISPQVLGYVMEKAFGIGALDCWFTPIQMKKNRPATKLSVLCPAELRGEISSMLFAETTTLGIRVNEIERECLEREAVSVETEFGK
ncbi:MAG TPA: nickel pincer cofactor biosynthesis protein LarC, partial [Pyrinomonadaceae bacterium]|nr:nickel pincer cofactor biosynthesis protein LarC [Pyrinomonadaceae bacterium]